MFCSFVNFALAPPTGRDGASLAGCPIADPVTSTVRPTLPLPTIPVDTGVVTGPPRRAGGGGSIDIDRGVVIEVDRGSVDRNRFEGTIDVERGSDRRDGRPGAAGRPGRPGRPGFNIDGTRYEGSVDRNRYEYEVNRFEGTRTDRDRVGGSIEVDRGRGGGGGTQVIDIDGGGVVVDVNRGTIDVDRGQGQRRVEVTRFDGGRRQRNRGKGNRGQVTDRQVDREIFIDRERINVDRGQGERRVEITRWKGERRRDRVEIDRSGGRTDVVVDRFGRVFLSSR